MNFQDASNLRIPEGYVRTIHDKNNRLLWGSVGYNVSFDGNATQTTYSGKNKMPMADADMTGEGEAGRNRTFRMALPAGTYTVSFDLDSFELGTNTAFGVYMQIYALSVTALIDLAIINITSTTGTGRKTVTFTINEDATTDRNDNIRIASTNWNNGARAKISNIQIESGSTATDYEPYVGGIPAPNPSYPQPISVVTGEQTVKVVGKNLLNLNDTFERVYPTVLSYTQESNSVEITANTAVGAQFTRYIIEVPDASQNYYLSCKAKKIVKGTDGTPRISVITAVSNNNTDWTDLSTGSMVVVDPTEGVEYSLGRTVSGYKYYRISFYNNNTTPVTLGEKTAYYDIQLERGSTATSYQAYTEQDYPISLGSIELAKIGTYQDRIYKNGEKWYVEKNVGKVVLDGTDTATASYIIYGAKDNVSAVNITLNEIISGNTSLEAISDKFNVYGTGKWQDWYSTAPNIQVGNMGKNIAGNGIYCGIPTTENTIELARAWFANNPAILYYQLATPTATEITDATLIAQLEAVYDWVRRHGYNAQVSGDLPIVINRTALPTA